MVLNKNTRNTYVLLPTYRNVLVCLYDEIGSKYSSLFYSLIIIPRDAEDYVNTNV